MESHSVDCTKRSTGNASLLRTYTVNLTLDDALLRPLRPVVHRLSTSTRRLTEPRLLVSTERALMRLNLGSKEAVLWP